MTDFGWRDAALDGGQAQQWDRVLGDFARPGDHGVAVCESTDRTIFDHEQDAKDVAAVLHEYGAPRLVAEECVHLDEHDDGGATEHWHLVRSAP